MATPKLHHETDDNDSAIDELKPGTKLLHGQYTIDSFLNSGGFGITYLARDSLDRKIVIKECFPSAFCRRSRYIVQARSRGHQNELKSIVRLFVQEARSLAKLDHPNIVGVHQVFEDNETAYMALDFVEGSDLLDIINDRPDTLTPPQITAILRDVLGAIGFVHAQGILHRDISPDNILIDQNLRPVLIDFGAAREQATKQTRVLSALRVVKDGYSPQEFYIAGSEQGPSSDLYALAATFYHLVAGDLPPNAQGRLAALAGGDGDPYVPLAGRITGYDAAFLAAIDKALSVLPKDRLPSAKAWLDMLDGVQGNVTPLRPKNAQAAVPPQMPVTVVAPKSKLPLLAGAMAVAAAAAVGGFVLTQPDRAQQIFTAAAAVVTQPDPVVPDSAAIVVAPEQVIAAIAQPEAPELPAISETRPATDVATPDLVLPETPGTNASIAADRVAPIDAIIPGNPVSNVGLETRLTVRLPFTSTSDESGIIAQIGPDAPDWVQPGLIVVDVNGSAVSTIADVTAIIAVASDLDPDVTRISASFGVSNPTTGERVEHNASLAVVQTLALPDGHTFETVYSDDKWQTRVTAIPGDTPGGLQTGDLLTSFITTSELLTGRDSLGAVLEREIALGTEQLLFAVRRDSSLWVATLTYKPAEND